MNEKQVRQKFVDVAISFHGATEGSSKHKKIVDTYNKISPLPAGYKLKYTDAWCAGSVSAWAAMCDLLDIIPAECSCPRQIELWKKLGRWIEDDSYIPKVGMCIYYDWDDSGKGDNKGSSDHVGVVVSVNDGKIKVIEGNISNSVGYRTISVNARYIRGYGDPDFASKATKDDVDDIDDIKPKRSVVQVNLNVLKKGSNGNDVKALQALLVGYGYSVGKSGVDGSFGSDTLKAIKEFQKAKKIEADGIVGKITWNHLLGVS